MYCRKCGNPLNDTARFCPKCGTAVRVRVNADQAPAVPEEPVIVPAVEIPEEPEAAPAVEIPEEPVIVPAVEIPEEAVTIETPEIPEESVIVPAAEIPEEPETLKASEDQEIPEISEAAEESLLEPEDDDVPEEPEIPELAATAVPPVYEPAAPYVAPIPQPAPAPVYQPVAETQAAPPATKKEFYQGKSRMKTLRIFSGVMLLVTGPILFWLSMMQDISALNVFFPSSSQTMQILGNWAVAGLISMFLFFWIPGIASLVLSKPTKVKSIILTAILGFCLIISVIVTLASAVHMVPKVIVGGIGFATNFAVIGSLFFLTLMALISIFQPASLVGEPAPTKGKPWKIVAGILNILHSLPILFGGAFGIVMMILMLTGYDDSSFVYSSGMALMDLFVPGIWMLTGAILSIRCSHGKHRPLSSAYADLMVVFLLVSYLWSIIEQNFILIGIPIESLFDQLGDEMTLLYFIVTSVVVFLILWYLVCAVISLVTAFNKKQELS